ncbi:transient receptor potential ion channel family protein [Aspergillus lucknowensis]|uniref:ML-like domain-containing protein n=1 Tax=Aspergillus lucknowensis TaxID=176173 RepID=A0ABR4LA16_9EURO
MLGRIRWLPALSCVLLWSLPATASRLIESSTLNILQPGNFSATHLTAVFNADDRNIDIRFIGETLITGYVTADVVLVIYGYETNNKTVNPCRIEGMNGFCPMNSGPLDLTVTNLRVPEDVIGDIPGVGFTVPDLDATIRIFVKSRETGEQISAVEAVLSNGKTVYQTGVGWATAVIAGLGLAVSVVVPVVRGYSDKVILLSGYTLSLFSFIQSQAMIGILAVPMPPIVRSWTQNLQWSMGIVHAGFLQTICTWYLRSTGGTPDDLFEILPTRMAKVLKRDQSAGSLVRHAKRFDTSSSEIVLRGLARVAFRAGIEETNLFLTSILIFAFVVLVVVILLAAWRVALVLRRRSGTGQSDWHTLAKGILYRIFLFGFAPVCIFCLWEFTQHDSPAELVVAAVSFLSVAGALVWAAIRILLSRRHAATMQRHPGYTLFSDTSLLHKYGSLYVQYNAKSSYFAAVTLGYVFIKSLFIAFAQPSPTTQAVAFVVIDATMLVAVSILRPWTDRKTNAFNITLAAVNFLFSIFVLFFSGVFDQPYIVSAVMGVILFVLGAAVTFALLLLVLVYAFWTEHLGVGATPMQSATGLIGSKVLDELAATARGEGKRESSVIS